MRISYCSSDVCSSDLEQEVIVLGNAQPLVLADTVRLDEAAPEQRLQVAELETGGEEVVAPHEGGRRQSLGEDRISPAQRVAEHPALGGDQAQVVDHDVGTACLAEQIGRAHV